MQELRPDVCARVGMKWSLLFAALGVLAAYLLLVLLGASLTQKSDLAQGRSVLVRVGSCVFVDRFCFSGQKERSTKSHELNTKLVTAPIDF
jgi:hypothetical protein